MQNSEILKMLKLYSLRTNNSGIGKPNQRHDFYLIAPIVAEAPDMVGQNKTF